MRIKKILVILLIAVVALSLIIFTVHKSSKNKGHDVVFKILPEDASVIIDNKNTKLSKGKVNLETGNYNIKISKDGFKDYIADINIADNNQTIIALLEPATNEAKEWVRINQKKYNEIESLSAELNQTSGQKFIDDNPIVAELPINRGYYRVDYSISEDDIIIVEIRSESAIGRIMAMNDIQNRGFKLSDYRIIFIDLANPFTGER